MIKIIIFAFVALGIFLFFKLRGSNPEKPVLSAPTEENEYPFPVAYISLQVQQQTLRMAYMDVRPEAPNGKVFLLLHGKNFNGAYWEQTAIALKEKGCRVIIPDQIGCGLSSKPRNIQYSLQQLAINTKQLLDSLQIGSVIVIGHSMGGMLATRFTLLMPLIVEKLILEDPIGLEDYKLKVPYQTIDQWYGKELNQTYEKMKEYQQVNYYHGTWQTSYEKWVRMQAESINKPDYALTAWNSALLYDMIFTQPVCYEFQFLKCPVLLIIGDLDKAAIGKDLVPEEIKKTLGNFPELGKETIGKIPDGRLVELKGIGHVPHLEDFDAFINAVTGFTGEK